MLGFLGAPEDSVKMGRCLLCWCVSSCPQDQGYARVPVAGHAQWAEVGGGILLGVR